ncbi:hypothetical protein FPV67DRAFT_1428350, partial [Lyophyllum atratum]
LQKPPWGGDKTIPEFLVPDAPPCDPFRVDVYCLGNAIKRNFVDGWEDWAAAKKGFEFMRELISDMVNQDPQRRPTMSEVVSRFDVLVEGLNIRKLRSPIVNVKESPGIFRSIVHWTRQLRYMARRVPAIPRAS